jgi:hypothetical protein
MITEKQFKVLKFLINKGRNYNTSVHGTLLKKVVYSDEIIKKYSHARKAKVVIDTMIFSYLGRMCRSDLIWSEYKVITYSIGKSTVYYVGHYCTKKGLEAYNNYLLFKKI